MSRFKKAASLAMSLIVICAAVPFASAEESTALPLGVDSLSYISNKTEQEYSFQIATAGNYVLETDYSLKGEEADTILYVYDQNHNLIGSNDDIYTNVAGLQNGFSIFKRYMEAGTYYAKAVSKDGTPMFCSIRLTNLDTEESFDYGTNKTISYTERLLFKEYKINLEPGRNVLIETSYFERLRDTGIKLYDAEHNLIAANDDIDSANYNAYSKVESALAPGTYYLKLVVYRPSNESLSCNVSFNNAYAPYAYITSPKPEGYLLQGENFIFDVNASRNTTNLALTYEINGSSKAITSNFIWVNDKNCFSATAALTDAMFDYPQTVNGICPFPQFKVVTTTPLISATAVVDGYITSMPRQDYTGRDQSWYYYDEIDNSFEGFASEEYNCMAYALDVTDQWLWPWSVGYPDFEPVCYYFSKMYSASTRPGPKYTEFSQTPFANPQLLFYTGHVVKVTKWDAEGNAIEGISKWGRAELIRSNLPDGLRAWGPVEIYIKGRVDE